MLLNVPVITIDGPSGSGKGTISSRLANALGWHFLDSGIIYRAVAYVAQSTNTPSIEEKLLPLVDKLALNFVIDPADNKPSVLWQQRDITDTLRTEGCGRLASHIATFAKLREALLDYQRAFRKAPGLVADGRDMGTVVFPDAFLKIFLFATLEERTKRRYLQLKATGKHVSLGSVRTGLERRDIQDKQRSAAPLKVAENAFIIDTTRLSISAVLQRINEQLQGYKL